MRRLKASSNFKKDLKRELKKPHSEKIQSALSLAIYLLQTDQVLPAKYKVHKLKGDFLGYLECHVRPDLLLIFKQSDNSTLELIRLGSHSELFE